MVLHYSSVLHDVKLHGKLWWEIVPFWKLKKIHWVLSVHAVTNSTGNYQLAAGGTSVMQLKSPCIIGAAETTVLQVHIEGLLRNTSYINIRSISIKSLQLKMRFSATSACNQHSLATCTKEGKWVDLLVHEHEHFGICNHGRSLMDIKPKGNFAAW